MQVRHIFVGIDLGDKNSVGRIAIDREKAERYGFVNNRGGRRRLFEEVKRRAGEDVHPLQFGHIQCGLGDRSSWNFAKKTGRMG
jgi:hypothetical protein